MPLDVPALAGALYRDAIARARTMSDADRLLAAVGRSGVTAKT